MRLSALTPRLPLTPLALAACLSAFSVPPHAAASTPDMTEQARALYGDSIAFDIYRNNARIGSHNVTFSDEADGLKVTSSFEMEIGLLFVKLFELQYQSEALWEDGKLVALSATTNRNGDISEVEASATDNALKIDGPNGPQTATMGIYPTNHWNSGVIGSTQLMNTITGKVNDVRLVPLGTERVATNAGMVEATRYKYEGAIQNEVWYDADGRWVAMQFPGDDGSLIELRCRQCVATASLEATR
ncbi:DUF6134 family protein [Parvibaculaceae bacterium PLY_AMNH_Bact1]|nr:DUF6134 family protein [Parvibaculaceae bacterium PLY_AMNH_Bact1]